MCLSAAQYLYIFCILYIWCIYSIYVLCVYLCVCFLYWLCDDFCSRLLFFLNIFFIFLCEGVFGVCVCVNSLSLINNNILDYINTHSFHHHHLIINTKYGCLVLSILLLPFCVAVFSFHSSFVWCLHSERRWTPSCADSLYIFNCFCGLWVFCGCVVCAAQFSPNIVCGKCAHLTESHVFHFPHTHR